MRKTTMPPVLNKALQRRARTSTLLYSSKGHVHTPSASCQTSQLCIICHSVKNLILIIIEADVKIIKAVFLL